MATDKKKEKYISALIKELKFHRKDLVNIKTIYIGGGTPSSLKNDLLVRLLEAIKENTNLDNIIEYSIETNPNDISELFASTIISYGVNRVSIGVQTFNLDHLKFLGRTHTNEDVKRSFDILRSVGFDNISVDMIFSLINQTVDELDMDLKQVIKLNPDHISYYSLILEEKTKLYHLYNQQKISMNTEDLEGIMYNKVIDFLTNNGYHQYEISNFCKPNKESIHNKTYWLNLEYLGIGSGSHSQYNNKRLNNPYLVTNYIENLENGLYSFKEEYEYDSLSDELLMGLRLTKGINIGYFNFKYNVDLLKIYPELNTQIKNGLLEITDGNLRFTRKGILLGNEVFKIFVEV